MKNNMNIYSIYRNCNINYNMEEICINDDNIVRRTE
jgi:hypothetical protein